MVIGLEEADDDGLLADLVARYEASLADATSPPPLSPQIEGDPALLKRWQGAKACLDLLYRVRDQTPGSKARRGLLRSGGAAALPPGACMPQFVGRFEIERLLGAGGVGLVYLARDPRLGRHVALKVPRFESFVNEDMRSRFLREAEAAARLSHPNVVSVLETGQDDLLCYIAAEYCEGPSLSEWLRAQTGPAPVLTAARLVQQLSGAVQHAHSRGVLHRDIKPGNVMLVPSASGAGALSAGLVLTPKLTDFGMAKLQEALCEETRTGATIGTPAYMSPEQAAGRVRELDSRTDVYALGTILYELLTGQPPLRGESLVDTLRRVLQEDPAPVRRLRPDVPRDLEAICLKCLAKSPTERYQTAQQLTNDLDRYLAGEPTLARPPDRIETVWKWTRRHPFAIGTMALVAMSLLALTIVTSIYNARLVAEIGRADQEAEASRRLLYSANVDLAHQSLLRDNVAQTRKLLQSCAPRPGQEDLREFCWRYLQASCDQHTLKLLGHQGDVFSVSFSTDGQALASAGKDGDVRIWDAATGAAERVLSGHTTEATCVVFSPSNQLLASGSEDRTVRLWDWRNGTETRRIEGAKDHVLAVAFSPDGKRLAVGGREPIVRVWNLEDYSLVKELPTLSGVVRSLQFSEHGATLLAGDEEGRVHCWTTSQWESAGVIERQSEINFALAVAAQSPLVAAGGRRRDIEIYSQQDGVLRPLTTIPEAHREWIQALAFNPVSSVLASAGKDCVVRLWSPETWRIARTFVGHTGRVWSVAWSPDGKLLATAGADGQVRLWESEPRQRQFPIRANGYRALTMQKSGTGLISCSMEGDIEYWNNSNEQPVRQTRMECNPIIQSELSPDQSKIAFTTYAGQTEVWSLTPLARIWRHQGVAGMYNAFVTWSDDSSLLAAHTDRRKVEIFDVASGAVRTRLGVAGSVWDLKILSDNEVLISTDNSIGLWDFNLGDYRWSAPGPYHAFAVSQGGRYIATDAHGGVVVLSGDDGQVICDIVVEGSIHALAISPDNRTLAVGVGSPNQIEFWDLQTSFGLMSIPTPERRPNSLFFSADGQHLFATMLHEMEHGQIMQWSIPKSDATK